MNIPTDPNEVTSMVDQRFMDFGPLHDRMDTDFGFYRLNPFRPIEGEAIEQKDAYTDNEPYVLAKQIISFITSSQLLVHVPNRRASPERREANQALEQFVYGIINRVDSQFLERADPRLIAQLASFAVIRGPLAMRRILRKDEYGETVPDALVFDPRWTVFQRDSLGLKWVCYKIRKQRDEVADTYEVSIPDSVSTDGMFVYDFYWRESQGSFGNAVLGSSNTGWLKPPSQVFTSQFPVIIVGGDDLPMLQSGDSGDRTIAQWAESALAANRPIWQASNRTTSYHLALTARSVNQVIKMFSLQGNKTLEENPNKEGGVIPLSKANQEDLIPLELSKTTHDAQILAAKIQRSKDSGGLPPQAFGIADPPLSGVAYRQLGARIDHVIKPFVTRVEQALRLAAEGWCTDFKSGFFRPITVYGQTHNAQPFEVEATPEVLQQAGRMTLKLEPKLPEDTLEKYTVAEIATRADPKTGDRLISYREARDGILNLKDAEWVEQEIRENQANTASPYAQALLLAKAAARGGNMQLAMYYMTQSQRILMQEQMEDMQMQAQAMMGGQPPMNGSQNGGGPAKGNDPRVMHATRFGEEPNTASKDAGYATRNPRPGGRSPENRGVERTRR